MFTWPMTSEWEGAGCLSRKVALSRHLHTAIIKNVLTAKNDIFLNSRVSQIIHQSKWTLHWWTYKDDVSSQASRKESLFSHSKLSPTLKKIARRTKGSNSRHWISFDGKRWPINQSDTTRCAKWRENITSDSTSHAPSCQTWARSLRNRKAALPDRRIKKQRCFFVSFMKTLFVVIEKKNNIIKYVQVTKI